MDMEVGEPQGTHRYTIVMHNKLTRTFLATDGTATGHHHRHPETTSPPALLLLLLLSIPTAITLLLPSSNTVTSSGRCVRQQCIAAVRKNRHKSRLREVRVRSDRWRRSAASLLLLLGLVLVLLVLLAAVWLSQQRHRPELDAGLPQPQDHVAAAAAATSGRPGVLGLSAGARLQLHATADRQVGEREARIERAIGRLKVATIDAHPDAAGAAGLGSCGLEWREKQTNLVNLDLKENWKLLETLAFFLIYALSLDSNVVVVIELLTPTSLGRKSCPKTGTERY